MRRVSLLFLSSALLAAAAPSGAQPPEPPSPIFLADLPNPNDFTLFANGGWDGNWTVGYNACWIQRISVPEGDYARAYVGARLGRMKNFRPEGKAPWEKKAYPGVIYMAAASTSDWSRAESVPLASTEDIPYEPDAASAVSGTGESRWFWAEVPLKALRPGQDHYLALWSPTPVIDPADHSPVLAAGWGTREVNSWVWRDGKGTYPKKPETATSLTVFEPAIALKLVPAFSGTEEGPKVKITGIREGKPKGKKPAPMIVWSEVEGRSVEKAWVEVSADGKKWSRAGTQAWSAPYVFTLEIEQIPPGGKAQARVRAMDGRGNAGASPAAGIFGGVTEGGQNR